MYASFAPWIPTKLQNAYLGFLEYHAGYQMRLSELISRIQTFKNGLETGLVEAAISGDERVLSDLQLRDRRLQSASACRQYVELQDDLRTAEPEVQRKQTELDTEQDDYLGRYFRRISEIFRQLGSDGFEVTSHINRRGDQPTVLLTASFQGERVKPDGLKTFLSESDRRALALSVFWAKVDSLSAAEKKEAVIILDDPITSFDEGRVDRAIRMLSSARHEFRQVIALSHYPRFLRAFFERARGEGSRIGLAKLVKTATGSHIEQAAPEDFVDSSHHRMFKRIKNVAELRSRDDVSRDLRVFLEAELDFRFRRSIEDRALRGRPLRDLIQCLCNSGDLSAEQRDGMNLLLDSLNADHHTWTDRSHTEQVNLAKDVLDFVYSRL